MNGRYVRKKYRKSAAFRLHLQLVSRKGAALRRLKLWGRLLDQALSTTHENHCCRDKPRDLLKRRRLPNLALDRATYWDWPW